MKKTFAIMLVVAAIGTAAFAQDKAINPHKHEAFDMLLGIGLGFDFSAALSAADLTDGESKMDLRGGPSINYDFYVFPWLSVNTGVGLGLYSQSRSGTSVMIVQFSIPLSVHINVPHAEWLYAGIGIGFNIPVDATNVTNGAEDSIDVTDEMYMTSLPIDIGFDFAKVSKRAGGRLFFRIVPYFGEGDPIVNYGVFWQFYNWKIFGKS